MLTHVLIWSGCRCQLLVVELEDFSYSAKWSSSTEIHSNILRLKELSYNLTFLHVEITSSQEHNTFKKIYLNMDLKQ